MAWKLVIPNAGGRRPDSAVTLSCRDNSHGREVSFSWVITMTNSLAKELGWDTKAFAHVFMDEDGSRAMLVKAPQCADAWRYTLNKTAMQGILPLAMKGTKRIGATRIPHEIEDGRLVLQIPIWAGGKTHVTPADVRQPRGRGAPRAEAAVAPPAAPVHAPTPAPVSRPMASQSTLEGIEKEDIREAIMMIGRGDTTLTIMEHFGWTRQRVDHMRRLSAAVPKRDGGQVRAARYAADGAA